MAQTKRYFFYAGIVVCLAVQILIAAACSPSKVDNTNATSTPQTAAKPDGQVSLLDGRILFVPPAGFKTLTKAELKRNLPDNSDPLLILANPDQTADLTIGQDGGMEFQSNQLADIKKFTEGTFRAAGSKWVTSEIVEINGRQWFHFEWESVVNELTTLVAPPEPGSNETPEVRPDRPFHYDEYSTIYDGKLLGFSFSADVKEYPRLKDAFTKSIQTIRLKE